MTRFERVHQLSTADFHFSFGPVLHRWEQFFCTSDTGSSDLACGASGDWGISG